LFGIRELLGNGGCVRLSQRLGKVLWGGACLIAVLPLFGASSGAAGGSSGGVPLVAGRPGGGLLEGGGADTFLLPPQRAPQWLLRVEQIGIDVVVEVMGPGGESLLAVDSPLGREGPETLLLISEAAGLISGVSRPGTEGSYGIEVRSEKQGVPAGRYEIHLQELPAATAVDRLRLGAEEALTEAGQLFVGKEEGAHERALKKVDLALEALRHLEEESREAEVSFLKGSYFEALGDFRSAAEAYGETLALWRRQGNARGQARALDRLGLAHNFLGQNARALEYLEEALALRQALGNREREAETRNHLCLVLQRLGRFRIAGVCYETSLEVARELGDRELEARLLNNLGGIYQNLGEPAKTLDHYRRTLELQRDLGDGMGEGSTLNNLGFYHHQLGEVEEALLHYGSALSLFEGLENRYWQARTLNNFGFAYLALGEPERARSYLLRALPLRREVRDNAGEAVTLRNLGRASAALGRATQATLYSRRALGLSLGLGDQRGVATARKLLGELLLDKQILEQKTLEKKALVAARQHLELAVVSLRPMGKRQEEAEVLELLARAHLGLEDLETAKTLAGQALALHREVRNLAGEVAALGTLARGERRQGHLEPARRHLETALAVLETLHGRLGDPNQRASFLATQRRIYELHVDLLMELHRREPSAGYELLALEGSERARSRSLLGLLGRAGAGLGRGDEELARDLRSAERRFAAKTRRQLQVLSRAGLPGEDRGEDEAEEAIVAEQELYQALTDLEALRARIRRRNPRYASWAGAKVLDTQAIRALLDGDTVLLEYLLGEERSYLWWVTPEEVTAYRLPPRQKIEELAAEVYAEVSNLEQRSGKTREALAALGRMLLGPVADRLEGQRLAVVADGALHFVPFGALTLPQPEGLQPGTLSKEPVIVRHEVVHLPSASVLALQRGSLAARSQALAAGKRAGGASKSVAILADPIFDRRDPRLQVASASGSASQQVETAGLRDAPRLRLDALDRLPHTRREAQAIAAQVPTQRLLLALGGEARRSRVVDDELGAFDILHFATHGFIHPRTPELSGLVLSQIDSAGGEVDGFLGLYDVSRLELSAQLVVLSGCRTALGKQVRGEGLVGLSRGFMYAGVPRVVASFWQVRDQATAELMARFYRGMLVEDLSPAAALRAAQLSLRQERRWRDPFYWAAFSLQGDWRLGP